MFLSKEIVLTRDNVHLAGVVAACVTVFALFMAAMIFLLFKIVFKKMEARFFSNLDSKIAPNGIRPISYFIPAELDSRLEQGYEQRRGTIPASIVEKVARKNSVRFL